MRTIGEVAALAGITTETLRFYDKKGLLRPEARSDGGYRLYSRDQLLRLREILIWRQLGFPLSDVAKLIDEQQNEGYDREGVLRSQLAIAREQLGRFSGLTRGLEAAQTAVAQDRPVADDDIFAGFAESLSTSYEMDVDGDERAKAAATHQRRVAHFSLMSGRSRYGTAGGAVDGTPRRIAVTDPIRIGEQLLALGIVPVVTGESWDTPRVVPYLPWPESVESSVRQRVRRAHFYGIDLKAIAAAEPDLIFDLSFTPSGQIGIEDHSWDGKGTHADLVRIAHVELLDAPLKPPGFPARLQQIGAILGLDDRAAVLRSRWRARVAVVRHHLAGQQVACLALNQGVFLDRGTDLEIDPLGCVANPSHEGQIFTALGLELLSVEAIPPPLPGRGAHWGGAAAIDAARVKELTAPTLFVSTDAPVPGWQRPVLESSTFAELPATRANRVFPLRWIDQRAGWFSSHEQLDTIARAFGVIRLRARGPQGALYAAVSRSGKVAVAAEGGTVRVVLHGPMIDDLSIELVNGRVAEIDLGDAAKNLSRFPDAYSLDTEDGLLCPLAFDRESAVERVAEFAGS